MDVDVNLVISFDLSSASGYSVGGTTLDPYSNSHSGRMQSQCVLATGGGCLVAYVKCSIFLVPVSVCG